MIIKRNVNWDSHCLAVNYFYWRLVFIYLTMGCCGDIYKVSRREDDSLSLLYFYIEIWFAAYKRHYLLYWFQCRKEVENEKVLCNYAGCYCSCSHNLSRLLATTNPKITPNFFFPFLWKTNIRNRDLVPTHKKWNLTKTGLFLGGTFVWWPWKPFSEMIVVSYFCFGVV